MRREHRQKPRRKGGPVWKEHQPHNKSQHSGQCSHDSLQENGCGYTLAEISPDLEIRSQVEGETRCDLVVGLGMIRLFLGIGAMVDEVQGIKDILPSVSPDRVIDNRILVVLDSDGEGAEEDQKGGNGLFVNFKRLFEVDA